MRKIFSLLPLLIVIYLFISLYGLMNACLIHFGDEHTIQYAYDVLYNFTLKTDKFYWLIPIIHTNNSIKFLKDCNPLLSHFILKPKLSQI